MTQVQTARASSTSEWTVEYTPQDICTIEDDDGGGSLSTWTIQHPLLPPNVKRRFQLLLPRAICNNTTNAAYPILLAFHGYGGGPQAEMYKWKDVAMRRNWILVSPEGTTGGGDTRRGWNATDCCGYPAESFAALDDIDFVNGIIQTLQMHIPDYVLSDGGIIAAATGFSNGGFFSSLLALAKHRRPSWLKAIVPTGGYQYDLDLYRDVSPLPIMMHHGGRDVVVCPEGCCTTNHHATSNCPFKIGDLREICLSVDKAFLLWAKEINHCESVVESDTEDVKCRKGTHCQGNVSTEFCLWTKDGHSWGRTMPGVEMAGEFLEGVFKNWRTEEAVTVTSSVGSGNHFPFLGGMLMLFILSLLGYVAFQALVGAVKLNRKSSDDLKDDDDEMVELISTEEQSI